MTESLPPPQCRHCGRIESAHPYRHPFTPQAPWCHRAHPHQEPCGPKPKAWEERERQAAAEARGWDSTRGGDEQA